ncbi:MAG: divergent polysaccharide deacetylase family protein [Candidatus Aminicenantes bacterium]|nr:divergent polysaccharide deacetylase family protein [Candidatus Aminicenantes bacterium]
MKSKKKSSSHAAPRAAAISFIIFIVVALATVVLLEFLDYRAGRYSLIFTKVIPLRQALGTSDKFDREWTETLVRDKVEFDFFKDREGIVHFKIKVADANYLPLAKELHQLVEKYRGLSRLSEVQGMKEQTIYLYQVRFDRQLTHVILLSRNFAKAAEGPAKVEAPAAAVKASATSKSPRLALIIDDVGYTDSLAEQLRDLNIPLTAAVIPSAPYALGQAERIHAYGLEEIIHLPMQPQDPANHHPRDEFVLSDSSPAEIAALIENAQAMVPYARGMNNHMGSLITSDPEAMQRVLELVKKTGLFFIDSKTTYETVAFALARRMQIKTAIRDIFLDDEQNYMYTSNQIKNLVELARKNGHALAIGHPFASTLAALRDAVPWLKQQKVGIVFASHLLE